MESLRVLIYLLSGLILVSAQVPGLGGCPDHQPMTEFDMERYMGTWYESERYFTVFEAGGRCMESNYTKAPDGKVHVSNQITGRLTGIKRIFEGEMKSVGKSGEGKMTVKFNSIPVPIDTPYWVLDTDYKSYSVVWSCYGLGLFSAQNAWIMTRERKPPNETLESAYDVLQKYGINKLFFLKTNQEDCDVAENSIPVTSTPAAAEPTTASTGSKKKPSKN